MSDYRQNVAAIVINQEGKIWVGERIDRMAWGFPQGGIDEGESSEAALKRELMEELSTSDFDFIARYPEKLRYDFPPDLEFSTWTFKGQEQDWYLVKLRPGAKLDISKHDEEFAQYLWCDLAELDYSQFGFKAGLYRTVLDYFKDKIK
ncbi:RNA pyrophosphohydrolase [Lactococcus termiticola]|uniref:NUDIX family hydrolase n=1 Tax=Lactococcus termiticola TaxID=2169526 RepID=A0A2R5HH91_9LACT|nr:RNA pyrophosphohydrolase [Lactococcus termiticola]GBG97409.1 NUDIX family hydrolase [Lactococcus termiticola]